jgi:hypothetical protein
MASSASADMARTFCLSNLAQPSSSSKTRRSCDTKLFRQTGQILSRGIKEEEMMGRVKRGMNLCIAGRRNMIHETLLLSDVLHLLVLSLTPLSSADQ